MRWLVAICFVLAFIAAGRLFVRDASICDTAPAQRAFFDTPASEQTMDEILINLVRCLPDELATQHAENIGANSGAPIRNVLAALYRNAPPDPDTLNALEDDIDALLRPENDRFTHSTLLNEAVRQQNHAWVKALLSAGADPNGSGSLMAYTALAEISHPSAHWGHIFPDGGPALPFLQTYLDHGGHVNTTDGGGFGSIALFNGSANNLDAMIFLLENGADGWMHSGEIESRSFSLSLFGSRIFGARAADYNEQMYVVVTRGLYQAPDAQIYALMVHDTYLAILEELSGSQDPATRHQLWTVQKVVGAMIDQGLLRPSDRMKTLLAADAIPDSDGGWILKEGALHQAHDDAQTGAINGSENW